ncbi:MAG: HD-GYP domain-containing protein, partial [Gemmatimonadales bacterium]
NEELAVYHRHPLCSAELLAPLELPWDVTAMIRGHQERSDGSGYPFGLRGDQIPMEARIIGIVDYYDSRTNTVSSHDAQSTAEVLGELESLRRWWGAEVCNAFYHSLAHSLAA